MVDDDSDCLFGERLKAARKRSGVSLTEMARRLGVSRSGVARFETGVPLNERTVLRYARALELDVELRLVPAGDDHVRE